MKESAWQTAQQGGVFAYMPQAEVKRGAARYEFLKRIDDVHEQQADAILEAMRYM